MKLITVILILSLGTLASAKGGSDGGGADTVSAGGIRSLLDLVEKDDVQYANLRVFDFDMSVGTSLSRKFRDQFDRYDSNRQLFDGNYDFSLSFLIALNYLGTAYQDLMAKTGYEVAPLIWIFVDHSLPEISDEGAIRVENPETKKQAAVQIGQYVFIDKAEFNLLDDENKAALLTHEAFLYAVKKLAPEYIPKNGTENIRTLNRRFIKYMKGLDENESYPSSAVKEAFLKLNLVRPPQY